MSFAVNDSDLPGKVDRLQELQNFLLVLYPPGCGLGLQSCYPGSVLPRPALSWKLSFRDTGARPQKVLFEKPACERLQFTALLFDSILLLFGDGWALLACSHCIAAFALSAVSHTMQQDLPGALEAHTVPVGDICAGPCWDLRIAPSFASKRVRHLDN